ncbi:MAG TPA: heparan-alpha-glucosaminide N-acetyltransferase domain-containing protein [Gemmatimonadales bacterium]|nr:heparan-alpha-glucosaminide N-acetyltransferase domain-containing protein [Gemmatimonadales bacterium]
MNDTTQRTRLQSLDIVRGLVMVLMAIDHVRVYSGLPAGGPAPGIFFTRWITNFVAPAFAFFAGTGAFLLGRKLQDRGVLARFLLTRGLWLVLLELTVIRVSWTFNLDYAHYLLAGVIWMLGWCMVLMAGLIWLPLPAIAAFGLLVMAGHNLMDLVPRETLKSIAESGGGWWLQLLYFGGFIPLGEGGPTFAVLYVIVPWIGVMAAGYAFGTIMLCEPAERRRLCLQIGWTAIVLFVLLRGLDLYGDPRHWHSGPGDPRPALFRFLNTSKYPASLLFLLMTLGPAIALLPWAENPKGTVARMLETFGRVPFFFYLLHIPLIHALACVVSLLREGAVNPWLFANHPMMPPDAPEGYTWSLALLYLVFAIAIALLYPACRWYARVKAESRSRWLSYL